MPTARSQGEHAPAKNELRSCRFRIHSNQVEVEYEGSEIFAVERLLPAIERLSKTQLGVNTSSNPDNSAGATSAEATPVQEGSHPTTREIAEKIEVEDWSFLVLAACYHLSVVRNLNSYSKEQILEQMLLGPDCSRQEMDHALRRILKELEKNGKLSQKEGQYTLSENTTKLLAQRLTWKD